MGSFERRFAAGLVASSLAAHEAAAQDKPEAHSTVENAAERAVELQAALEDGYPDYDFKVVVASGTSETGDTFTVTSTMHPEACGQSETSKPISKELNIPTGTQLWEVFEDAAGGFVDLDTLKQDVVLSAPKQDDAPNVSLIELPKSNKVTFSITEDAHRLLSKFGGALNTPSLDHPSEARLFISSDQWLQPPEHTVAISINTMGIGLLPAVEVRCTQQDGSVMIYKYILMENREHGTDLSSLTRQKTVSRDGHLLSETP